MNEIKCPKCGTVFQIDEQDYESIVKQVRDHTFEEELNERKAQFQRELESAVKLAKADTEKKLLEQVNQLKMANANLETRIQSSEEEKKQAVQSTKAAVEKEYTSKISELTLSKTKLENDLKLKDTEWWLATGNSLNSYEVYVVKGNGYIEENTASGYKRIRPVIVLNNNVMIKSGTGTASDPFVLK